MNAVRPGARDLAALLEMAGRPDANRFADDGDRRRRPRAIRGVGCASQSASAPTTKAERARHSRQPTATRQSDIDVTAGLPTRWTLAEALLNRRRHLGDPTSSRHHGAL